MGKIPTWLIIVFILACILYGVLISAENNDSSSSTSISTPTFTVFDMRDLVTYPDTLKGAHVQLTGKVFNVNSDSQLQMYVGDNNDPIYVIADEPFKQIYEEDIVIVTGFVGGERCGENPFGARICMPLIEKAVITKN